ncbi:hypothetical protein HDU67_000173 [Dinochytrium kinnereticum]|nr:hypothetical protein HDU67_000173 [Dinochytrium kinnereticum]
MEFEVEGGFMSRSRQGSLKKTPLKDVPRLQGKPSNHELNRSNNHSRSSLKGLLPAESESEKPASDPEYQYALAMAGMNFGLAHGAPAGQDSAEIQKALERQRSSSSLKRSTSSLSRSRAGSTKIPQLDGIPGDKSSAGGSRLAKSTITANELNAMASTAVVGSTGHQLDVVKGKSVSGAAAIIRSQPNHGQAITDKLRDLSLVAHEGEKPAVVLPAIESALKANPLQKSSGVILASSSTPAAAPSSTQPKAAKLNQVKLDSSIVKPVGKPEQHRSPHPPSHRLLQMNYPRPQPPTNPPNTTNADLMIVAEPNKHSRKASEEHGQDTASEGGSNNGDFKYLSPHEIRERMKQYQATSPDAVAEKRAASAVSASSAGSGKSQKPGEPQVYDGRPVWKPGGGMDAQKREEFIRNRLRAKEIAERTRKEILANCEGDSDSDENGSSVEASEESIRDALGPFSRPDTAGPPPLDEKGNALPTANTFAHTILKVMDKYDAPLVPVKAAAEAAVNLASGMALSARPTPGQKKIISYPIPSKKKKVMMQLPVEDEPQPMVEEQPPKKEEEPEPVPEPKPVKPEVTPAEKLRNKAYSYVAKFEEERFSPRPQEEPCTPHELRVLFVNDFSVLDGYVTNQRNNEMAMLVRDVNIVPTGILAPLDPDQVTEMSWNLYRYLRSMSESFLHQEVAKGLVEIMEEDEEEEHRMFEIKRLIARLPSREFIKVKAVIGHIERLANITRSQGVTLHASLAGLFGPVMLRRPCRKKASTSEVKTPFDRAFRAGSAYTVHSRSSIANTHVAGSNASPPPLGAITDNGGRNSMASQAAPQKLPEGLDSTENQGRGSVVSVNYGSLKKKRDHGASMGHMIVAGVTLKDAALDPTKWEALTVASDSTEGALIDSTDNVAVSTSEMEGTITGPVNQENRSAAASAGNLSEASGRDEEEEEQDGQDEGLPNSALTEAMSTTLGRPSSATTCTTTRSSRKKKGLRPVPGFRQEFPERDATTPLMPPSISPRELLAIITNQAERDEATEDEEDGDLAMIRSETEFGQIPLGSSSRKPKESLSIVTARTLTRLSTMTEMDSVTSNMSVVVSGSKVSTAVRPVLSAVALEDDETPGVSPGADIDFGEDDPDGFGWSLITKKGIAQALFLEETVNTAQAAAVEIMLKYYANVFAWNTFQQQQNGRSSRQKTPSQTQS